MKVTVKNQHKTRKVGDLSPGTPFTFMNRENVYIKCGIKSARVTNMMVGQKRTPCFCPATSMVYLGEEYSDVYVYDNAEVIVS